MISSTARVLITALTLLAGCFIGSHVANAEQWSVPLAGNTFPASPRDGRSIDARSGLRLAAAPEATQAAEFSAYFRVNQAAKLTLSFGKAASTGNAKVITTVNGERFVSDLSDAKEQSFAIGDVNVKAAGYVELQIQAIGQGMVTLGDVMVQSDSADLKVDFVQNNNGNMFYWGRRGPSVHLRYSVPRDRKIQYAYSELTVPEGLDPIGSYFMANGFGQGYFGMQVNGPSERRVLFSVWSPYKTDNPREIPADQRIQLLGQGEGVHIGQFGNEGSGGQSYMRYPWVAGRTYRFLTEVKPVSETETAYTCWFGDKDKDEWRLVASFKRPKTNTYLTGFHSFLENFNPSFGQFERKIDYANIWVVDREGQWHSCDSASFSVDATGGRGQRLDFAGGSERDHFFLRNCGFFSETTKPGSRFEVTPASKTPPEIDLEGLPRK